MVDPARHRGFSASPVAGGASGGGRELGEFGAASSQHLWRQAAELRRQKQGNWAAESSGIPKKMIRNVDLQWKHDGFTWFILYMAIFWYVLEIVSWMWGFTWFIAILWDTGSCFSCDLPWLGKLERLHCAPSLKLWLGLGVTIPKQPIFSGQWMIIIYPDVHDGL